MKKILSLHASRWWCARLAGAFVNIHHPIQNLSYTQEACYKKWIVKMSHIYWRKLIILVLEEFLDFVGIIQLNWLSDLRPGGNYEGSAATRHHSTKSPRVGRHRRELENEFFYGNCKQYIRELQKISV